MQPKVVRRGRPPGKNLKKSLGRSSVDRVGPELSSGATLATGEDNTSGSNAYNLRRGGPTLFRFQSTDASATSHRSRNGENHSEWLCDWNNEFPGLASAYITSFLSFNCAYSCFILFSCPNVIYGTLSPHFGLQLPF